jgi:hypothetical protein
MAVTSRKLYDTGRPGEVMAVIRGSMTPGIGAGDNDDILLPANDPVYCGLSILDGHAFCANAEFTEAGGTISVGIILKSADASFGSVTIATLLSAVTAASAAGGVNVHIPVVGAAGTGLPATAVGLVAGLPISMGNPTMVPNIRVRVNTGITDAPLVDYLVFLRCVGAKRS